ncbi:hypothetical protein Trydic_g6025 [Trypoxylus dichotomus]
MPVTGKCLLLLERQKPRELYASGSIATISSDLEVVALDINVVLNEDPVRVDIHRPSKTLWDVAEGFPVCLFKLYNKINGDFEGSWCSVIRLSK